MYVGPWRRWAATLPTAAIWLAVAAQATATAAPGPQDETKQAWAEAEAKPRETLVAECQRDVRLSCWIVAKRMDNRVTADVARSGSDSEFVKNVLSTMKFGYDRACALGWADACINLAIAYGKYDAMKDPRGQSTYFHAACGLGDREGCENVAEEACDRANELLDLPGREREAERIARTEMTRPRCIYAVGVAAERRSDFGTAMDHYAQAARMGNPYAMTNLGGLYNNVWHDYPTAVGWYRKALQTMSAPPYLGNDDVLVNLIRTNMRNSERRAQARVETYEAPSNRSSGTGADDNRFNMWRENNRAQGLNDNGTQR